MDLTPPKSPIDIQIRNLFDVTKREERTSDGFRIYRYTLSNDMVIVHNFNTWGLTIQFNPPCGEFYEAMTLGQIQTAIKTYEHAYNSAKPYWRNFEIIWGNKEYFTEATVVIDDGFKVELYDFEGKVTTPFFDTIHFEYESMATSRQDLKKALVDHLHKVRGNSHG
ncbi:MAG: hypothetical protein OEY01_03675 [Desulfobulbaceae bacterium]|nr:hypothetical protein [Desulfobulbaceae bacterium]